MEKKFFDAPLEIRFLSDEGGKIGVVEGYGSVFGTKDSYGDIVVKGAFSESLSKNGTPAMLWQHDPSQPIGVWTEAREDQNGLLVRGEINLEVQGGREAYALLKQKAVKGLSIGFMTEEEEYDRVKEVRYVKKVNLLEVSLVTFPANKSAGVMSWRGELPQTEREFEKFLRSVGYGRTQSKAIVSGGFKAFMAMQRDADEPEADDVQRDADGNALVQEAKRLLIALQELNANG